MTDLRSRIRKNPSFCIKTRLYSVMYLILLVLLMISVLFIHFCEGHAQPIEAISSGCFSTRFWMFIIAVRDLDLSLNHINFYEVLPYKESHYQFYLLVWTLWPMCDCWDVDPIALFVRWSRWCGGSYRRSIARRGNACRCIVIVREIKCVFFSCLFMTVL